MYTTIFKFCKLLLLIPKTLCPQTMQANSQTTMCLDNSVGKVRITKTGIEFELIGSNPSINLVIFQKFRHFV